MIWEFETLDLQEGSCWEFSGNREESFELFWARFLGRAWVSSACVGVCVCVCVTLCTKEFVTHACSTYHDDVI